jgi:hypothetical protein
LLFEFPAVKRARKVNTMSRIQRRLGEVETEQPNAPLPSVSAHGFVRPVCRGGTPGLMREWQREQGAVPLLIEAGAR